MPPASSASPPDPRRARNPLIRASSNEGDAVLDAYCGCGTTVAVAERLKRKWIGIDITFSRNQARINEKKGADGGIDGIAYFLIYKDSNGKAIFQVKSGASNRATLATLNSDRQREKAEFGFLITMDLPTKAMRDEIAAAGKYKHPMLDREDDRLQVVTVAEILAGKRLDLPMARQDAVKSARAAQDETRQATLL